MSFSPRQRQSSPTTRFRSRTRSRSPARSYRETSEEANNPGNNLYVTGLSVRVSEKDLQEHFEQEGKVLECRLVVDPRTRESRGFGFVTMGSAREADRCIKYLHRSTLEGRVITVEKAKRKRARTPTPGQYLGVRSIRSSREPAYSRDHERRGPSSYDDPRDGGSRRNPRYSPRYSPFRGRQESPYRGSGYRRERSITPKRSHYRSPPRRSTRARTHSRSVTPYYNRENH
jgi:RNA recognition motif-containing protein